MKSPKTAESHPEPTIGSLFATRQSNFNLLRLLFTTLVVLSHGFIILQGHKEETPLFMASNRQATVGTLGVNAFFVISGFLLMRSWEKCPNAWNFFARRFLRVHPGLTASLLFCIFVVGPLAGVSLPAYFLNPETYKILTYLLVVPDFHNALPGVFENNPLPFGVNGSLWTIKYEIYCYVFLAIFASLGLLRPRWMLGLFALLYLSYNLVLPWIEAKQGTPLRFALTPDYLPRLSTYFFAGCALYVYRARIPMTLPLALLCVFVLVLSLHSGLSWTLPIAGSYLLMYLAFSRSIRFYDFGRKYDLSYGTYLYAFPIQQLLVQYWAPWLNPWTLFVVTMALVLPVAMLSWKFVESPFLRLKDQRLKRGESAPTALGWSTTAER